MQLSGPIVISLVAPSKCRASLRIAEEALVHPIPLWTVLSADIGGLEDTIKQLVFLAVARKPGLGNLGGVELHYFLL